MERDRAIKLVQDAILEHLHQSPSTYSLNTVYTDIGGDSLDVVAVCILIEDHLNGQLINDVVFSKNHTVMDLVQIVEKFDA